MNNNLSEIENFVISKFKEERPDPTEKNWLHEAMDNFYNPTNEDEKSDIITDCIQQVINTAGTRENAHRGLGLSKSRIKSYQNLLNIFRKFQGRKKYRVKDVDINFGKRFLDWLLNSQNYSEGYARKKIDDLKSVCADAEVHGIETSSQLKKVKGGKSKNDFIIYLNPSELDQIARTELKTEALENVRKWLLLGCNLGQRGGDLLKLTEDNFIVRNGLELIELKQQKTGKNVTIPVLPTTKEILKEGLPYKIAIQNFNDNLKELCHIAGINEHIPGAKVTMVDEQGKEIPKDKTGKYIKKGKKRKITGSFPKCQLISSHVCRRSFASNNYGTLPTPLIMQITQHSSEKMLLQYIGKSGMDYAQQIADFYAKQIQKEKKDPEMHVIKNAANE
ncbi:phage integrase SAM-like domain-containing protein [Zunongwangia sp. F260]|uniref:Phage integrase SAM-like domain-containing protein n=1 Tax=Autumnicola lenta TaxID=3075593 RepID=A0ABU3CM87_9FLAO|nr:phage integrase SAM-like domain-containing protein [Zunongwangia sp. F260]MDT0647468.1 phage integrase SAM-like domain-containing protein [Zunongwangia sp. F260]